MKADNHGHPEPRTVLCPREESNLDLGIRSPLFYPLNYEGRTPTHTNTMSAGHSSFRHMPASLCTGKLYIVNKPQVSCKGNV
ncbi:MAG: hypothetical protein UX14_C0040G0006 [Parcubacteria group bacterium GW2011_GWF1_45_5]|nr:MAG: hypothetical protein UX14_C0040G0006 [Parcubacteria group bacterium GW2011_GWF1_45_5]